MAGGEALVLGLELLLYAAPLDRITYPVADSLVLLIMGGLCGRFLGTARPRSASRLRLSVRPLAAITIAFVIARLIQHHLIGIYSSAADQPITALVWSLTTGLVSALVLTWFDGFLRPGLDRFSRTLILGVVIFGGNLLLFNFFMPLVFAADLPDLMIRTVIDTLAVTVGVTAIPISFTDVRQLNTNQLSDQPD